MPEFLEAASFNLYRYGFEGMGAETAKRQFIEILRSTSLFEHRGISWALGDVEELSTVTPRPIFARLGPMRVEEAFEYDADEHIFVKQDPEAVAGQLLTIVFVPSQSSVAIEQTGEFSANVLGQRLEGVVRTSDALDMAEFYVEPILIQEEFLTAIASLDLVSYVKVHLRPSNPRYREIWRENDEDQREMEAESVRKIVKAKKGGSLQIKPDTSVHRDLHQVADGYGRGKVVGTSNGETRVVHSYQHPATIQIDRANLADNADAARLIGQIVERSDIA